MENSPLEISALCLFSEVVLLLLQLLCLCPYVCVCVQAQVDGSGDGIRIHPRHFFIVKDIDYTTLQLLKVMRAEKAKATQADLLPL